MKSALFIIFLSLSAALAAPKGPKNAPVTHKQKTREAPVQSPTKYGFVPQRTAASYAAVQPKYQSYQIKRPQYEQYSAASQQYASASQYLPQEHVQYVQPEQQYEQYENAVQYVSDNSVQDQQIEAQPQYYYVQQAEPGVESKALQYVTFVPSYVPNSIPVEQKYQSEEPPATTTVAKYTSVAQPQYSSQKEYLTPPSPQYSVQEHYSGYKREPKSLLDSYVPSYIQLQYLRQQGKSIGYTKF